MGVGEGGIHRGKADQLYINGEYTASTGNDWLDIINPSTEEVISRVPRGTEEDVSRAVQAASDAQKAWELTPMMTMTQEKTKTPM